MMMDHTAGRRSRIGFALMLAAALCAGACGSPTAPVSTAPIAGIWNLQIYHNAPMPHIEYSTDGGFTAIESDVFAITRSGTFTRTVSIYGGARSHFDTTVEDITGTCNLDGNSVRFWFADANHQPMTARWSGNIMTVIESGDTSVYVRL